MKGSPFDPIPLGRMALKVSLHEALEESMEEGDPTPSVRALLNAYDLLHFFPEGFDGDRLYGSTIDDQGRISLVSQAKLRAERTTIIIARDGLSMKTVHVATAQEPRIEETDLSCYQRRYKPNLVP